MAGSIEVELKLDGFAAYSEKAHEALRKALQFTAEQTVDDAKLRAPVSMDGSHGNDPGFMRDSTGFEFTADLEVTIEASAPYSGFVNYGTRHQSAQPWFTPAIDQATERLSGWVETLLNELEHGGI